MLRATSRLTLISVLGVDTARTGQAPGLALCRRYGWHNFLQFNWIVNLPRSWCQLWLRRHFDNLVSLEPLAMWLPQLATPRRKTAKGLTAEMVRVVGAAT